MYTNQTCMICVGVQLYGFVWEYSVMHYVVKIVISNVYFAGYSIYRKCKFSFSLFIV